MNLNRFKYNFLNKGRNMRTIAMILSALSAFVGLTLLIAGNNWMFIFHGLILLFLGTGTFMIVSYKDVILKIDGKNSKKKV